MNNSTNTPENSVNPGLLNKANEMDEKMQMNEAAKAEADRILRDYRRDLAKLNAAMIRNEENPPTANDIARLKYCMHAFVK